MGAREKLEGAAVGGGDDLDGVGIGDVFGTGADFERGDFHGEVRKGCEQGVDVRGLKQWLVALDVDVDRKVIPRRCLRDGE